MFSHDFAKAFFGKADTIYREQAWVHRLKEMSLRDEPINYLLETLKKKREE